MMGGGKTWEGEPRRPGEGGLCSSDTGNLFGLGLRFIWGNTGTEGKEHRKPCTQKETEPQSEAGAQEGAVPVESLSWEGTWTEALPLWRVSGFTPQGAVLRRGSEEGTR